jgi:hypothetical protein
MRAVGYQNCLPIDEPAALVDIEVAEPKPIGRDLLVKVRAVSVNPVDTKVRKAVKPDAGGWKVLGWDAAGTLPLSDRTSPTSSRAIPCSTPARSIGRGRTRSST